MKIVVTCKYTDEPIKVETADIVGVSVDPKGGSIIDVGGTDDIFTKETVEVISQKIKASKSKLSSE